MATPFVLRDFYAVIYYISLNFKHKNPLKGMISPRGFPREGTFKAG